MNEKHETELTPEPTYANENVQYEEQQYVEVEKIYAWKELLSSVEAKEFVNSTLISLTEVFGQTREAKITHAVTNVAVMVVAFICIGTLAHMNLISEGTTGVLAGIIIGYFFKQEK